MTAGLPGTGLGGMYYLLSILLMCAKEVVHRIRGTGDRVKSRIAREQILILAGAMVTLWLNGMAIQYLLHLLSRRPGGGGGPSLSQAAASSLPVNALAVSVGILAGLLLLVQVLRLLVRNSALRGRASRRWPSPGPARSWRRSPAGAPRWWLRRR